MPTILLQREIDSLNKRILQLGGQVEENLRLCIQSIHARTATRLRPGMETDEDQVVDSLEVQVEEECLKLLALYQPVASDLRYIVAVLKINGDLERIGDLSKSLEQHAVHFSRNENVPVPSLLTEMAGHARDMLTRSLNALIERDVNACRRIIHEDQEVDRLFAEVYDWLMEGMDQHLPRADARLNIYLASKDLERIADHACNIAEDVIYMVTGEIVRHHELALEED
jgi:phosphate transport system protein